MRKSGLEHVYKGRESAPSSNGTRSTIRTLQNDFGASPILNEETRRPAATSLRPCWYETRNWW